MKTQTNSLESILGTYAPTQGFHDEFLAPTGGIRPPWSAVVDVLEQLGADGLSRRVDTLNRLVKEYGVTYNVYSEEEKPQSWAMDVLPFIMAGEEWAKLEQSLSQRFHLLDLILRDCYGKQQLLEGGRIAPDLVLGNPGYLTACHDLLPESHHHIQLYCADLARSPDGNWWVLSDRLDAASGLGYALENRMLSHRVIPEALRPTPVRPLQPFLAQYCETIDCLAPGHKDNPTVVLLTPGPRNETYFEHAFLARTLGYPLVEGDDLTVRNSRVYMKTITGLEQVDVIVRRLDAEWCDPLELRSDSLLGVPGLLQAVRSRNVALANGMGCGMLQAPAFSAFLPGLCKLLLGEDLKLPSVATWWCGQPAALDYVIENLSKLVIKPAKHAQSHPAVFGDHLSKPDLATLRERILMNPSDWCGQEIVAKATTPSFHGSHLTPAHFLMRVYLTRHRGGYRMMPGGFVRASQGAGYAVSMQEGGVSKDLWVTGKHSENDRLELTKNALLPSKPIIIRRSAHSLPSRVADNLYWLGRYFERAESQTRVIRVLINALMDEAWQDRSHSILQLFSAIASEDDLKKICKNGANVIILDQADAFLSRWLREEDGICALRSNVSSILRTARRVKERLSLDAWHAMSNLDELAATLPFVASSALSDKTLQTMDDMLGLLSGISGLSSENMTRGHGWHFQDLGRRIERALHLSNLIYSTLTEPSKDIEPTLWLLLECADSLITYRRRYFTAAHTTPVLDLLLCDPQNPRSMSFQANEISEHVANLPHQFGSTILQPVDKASLRLSSHLGLCEVDELDTQEADGRRANLATFLDDLASELCALSDQVGSHYFAITSLSEHERANVFPEVIQT